MATLLNPFLRGLDANGDAASGALLYVFEAGTTTPVTTYSDSSLTTPQAQPLVANAAGEFEQSFLASGTYKIRVADADAVVMYETDNVRMADRPDDPVYFDTEAELLASTNTYATGSFVIALRENRTYEAAASGATDYNTTNAGGQKFYNRFDAEYDTVADLLASSGAYTDGTIVKTRTEGYTYNAASSGAHVTNAGGQGFTIADYQWYFEHFGVEQSPNDCRAICQAAIDAAPEEQRIMFATQGKYRTTGTIYLKKNGMQIAGPNGGFAGLEFVNAAGGTIFAGDSDGDASLNTYTRCQIDGIRIYSVAASTDASRVVDLTCFSYGFFDVRGQTKRTDAEHYYGQGNNGESPYYNTIIIDGVFGGDGAGGTNYTQTALRFAQGAWAGGSNGGNANTIRCQGRAAALRGIIDIQSGTGNMCELLNGESINDWYVRLNYNPATDSGTSSGSNTQNSFKDTAKAWATNSLVSSAVKITGGTGAGQVRTIGSNTSTTATLKDSWGVLPDATSTYEIYAAKASGNQLSLGRAEGLASLNPDFIQAHPATAKTNFSFSEVQSIGSGLFVRDDSGSTDNNWFNGDKVTFTHTFENPGPSANINAYPRISVFGGLKVPSSYAVEWLVINESYTGSADTADVYLDAGGTAAGGGSPSLHAQILNGNTYAMALPASDEKISVDGIGNSLFLNLQTGASFSATVDVQATFCVSLL